MGQLPIKRTVERVPGGTMIVPLFLGAIIDTLDPNVACAPAATVAGASTR